MSPTCTDTPRSSSTRAPPRSTSTATPGMGRALPVLGTDPTNYIVTAPSGGLTVDTGLVYASPAGEQYHITNRLSVNAGAEYGWRMRPTNLGPFRSRSNT